MVTASDSDTSRFGDVPGAVAAALTGNTVRGFADGIEVASDGQVGDTASATIGGTDAGDSNSISGDATGILVTGVGASAQIIDNNTTITDNDIGVEVDAGSASITGNTISDNTQYGVYVTGDGSATIAGATLTGNATGVMIDAGSSATIEDYYDATSMTDTATSISGGHIGIDSLGSLAVRKAGGSTSTGPYLKVNLGFDAIKIEGGTANILAAADRRQHGRHRR